VPTFRTPYGYHREKGDGPLVPNGNHEVVQMIFEMKAEGEPLTQIAGTLLNKDIPSPSGGRKWSHSTLAQVLRNRVYLGELKHSGNFNPEAHKPLIDPERFDRAQSTQAQRPVKGTPRSSEALLPGIARCTGCGHTLKIVVGHKGALRYYCKSDSYANPCPAPAFARADQLDPFAEAWFLSAVEGEGIVAEAVEADRKLSAAQGAVDRAEASLRAYAATGDVLDAETFRTGQRRDRPRWTKLALFSLSCGLPRPWQLSSPRETYWPHGPR